MAHLIHIRKQLTKLTDLPFEFTLRFFDENTDIEVKEFCNHVLYCDMIIPETKEEHSIYMFFPNDYPFTAPLITCDSIKHPKFIDDAFQIGEWSPILTIRQLLLHIYTTCIK